MEKSSFFNSVNHDRRYNAGDWAEYFSSFIGNGVFPAPATGLQVQAAAGMNIIVKPGKAWINGYFYQNTDNLQIPIGTADGVLKRIARIVIRCDYSLRRVVATAKLSEFSGNPQAPVLQRDVDAYEICIGDVLINAGAISISQSAITDQRWNTSLCGVVAGVVQQIDPSAITVQFDSFFSLYSDLVVSRFAEYNALAANSYADFSADLTAFKEASQNGFEAWFDTVKGILSGDVAANMTAALQDITARVTALENQSAVAPEYFTVAWLGSAYLGTTYLNGEV
jgi:hypothetical protein